MPRFIIGIYICNLRTTVDQRHGPIRIKPWVACCITSEHIDVPEEWYYGKCAYLA